jgi:hypothetical protein
LRKRDLIAFGYREVEHAGFSWYANEAGARFLSGIDDWSQQKLTTEKGWNCRTKRDHAVYVACDREGMWYLIKDYPPVKKSKNLLSREASRATREFFKTLVAHKKGIPTVLPLAVGKWKEDGRRGVIIYPFLDQAIPLERVYDRANASGLTVREKQSLEKAVGKLMRTMHDAGAYPIDAHLDHFLVSREKNGRMTVCYIDFERIEFHFCFVKWVEQRRLIKSLGRLLARLEWLRVSGGAVNRPGVMRMGLAFLGDNASAAGKKRLRLSIVRAAKKFWDRRGFGRRGLYGFRSFEPVDKTDRYITDENRVGS